MDENSLLNYSLEEPEILLFDCHINNTQFTFDNNQKYNPTPHSFMSSADINCEGYDLTSDATLNYINKMLLEEDIDEKCCTYDEEEALHATEKTFYDILGQENPSPPGDISLVNPNSVEVLGDDSNSSLGLSSNGSDQIGWIDSYPLNSLNHTRDAVRETEFSLQFNKGLEEALKFVPNFDKLVLGSESSMGATASSKPQKTSQVVDNKSKGYEFRSKKKYYNDPELDVIEGRALKQTAVGSDDLVRNEKMDKTLLCRGKKYIDDVTTIREIFQKEMKDESKKTRLKNLKTSKAGGKKKLNEGLVDLRSLLLTCAQAVFTNDHVTANEQIKKIREHSSPNGDWSQRLAIYFVDGLEARLAGTGSEIYRKLASDHVTLANMLKAYRFYLAACPYKRAAFFFSNQTIFNALKDESRMHIIDLSILLGAQWPAFFERFSTWKSTPPKIRITGIDTPQSGFRPAERVNETGKRLADYAQSFNVPFEYEGIAASDWENIRIEDFNVNKNELLVVNCIFSEILADGATIMDRARDHVLRTIKEINPHVFIIGVVNSSINGPYFLSRFREALYHYSALFDMLDTTMPRGNPERSCLEKHLGQKALNTIACEGSERVERPETYKHWQSKIARVGFVQMPNTVKNLFKSLYHKEFVMGEENGWLVMGWKGRILLALSTWKPNLLDLNPTLSIYVI